jgi:hypothetical protein
MSKISQQPNGNGHPTDARTANDPAEASAAAGSNTHSSHGQPDRSYTVGYGRPPKHTRFKPGQSGNPKGRPKQDQTLKEQLLSIYTSNVAVTDGNRRQRMPALVAIKKALMGKALKGDTCAALAVLRNAKVRGLLDELGLVNQEKSKSKKYYDATVIDGEWSDMDASAA